APCMGISILANQQVDMVVSWKATANTCRLVPNTVGGASLHTAVIIRPGRPPPSLIPALAQLSFAALLGRERHPRQGPCAARSLAGGSAPLLGDTFRNSPDYSAGRSYQTRPSLIVS